MAVALGLIIGASAARSLGLFTAGFVLLFVLTGIGNGSTYKMIPAIFRGQARLAIAEGADADTAFARARRLSGAAIGIVGAVGALGGLFINLAFRQAFLTAKTGDPAYWSFLAFYVVCAAVTFAFYLRRPPPTWPAHAWPTPGCDRPSLPPCHAGERRA
jgi:NNP family nitrate/nitrite transporter-like MFS transporter